MNSKLFTIAGAALFMLTLDFSAAASTYDVSGAFPFSTDTFSGTIDVNGSSVGSANIALSGSSLNQGELDLTDVAFSFEAGPVWTIGVDNSTYLLSFLFTLPSSLNDEEGNISLATLSEFVTNEVCRGEEKNRVCGPETTTQFLKGFGYGTVMSGSETTTNGDLATPLPAAFPLFATGLGLMGLFGWCRKRNTTAVATA